MSMGSFGKASGTDRLLWQQLFLVEGHVKHEKNNIVRVGAERLIFFCVALSSRSLRMGPVPDGGVSAARGPQPAARGPQPIGLFYGIDLQGLV